MSDIINDIIEEVNVKPEKSKSFIKWTLRIAVLFISLAFIIVGFIASISNRIDNFEKDVKSAKTSVDILDSKFNTYIRDHNEDVHVIEANIKDINNRVDEIYVLINK